MLESLPKCARAVDISGEDMTGNIRTSYRSGEAKYQINHGIAMQDRGTQGMIQGKNC